MPASLSDNFNDNSIDLSAWDVTALANQNGSVTVSETGGQEVITPLTSTAGTNRNGLISDNTFNLTQGFAMWTLVQRAGASASVETRCGVAVDASNYLSFEVANATITFRRRQSGVNSDTTTAYSSSSHKFLMLVFCGTAAGWYTSPDAITWTAQRTGVTVSFAVTALKLFLDAGTTGSVSPITPSTAIFDDVSIGSLDIVLPAEQMAQFGGVTSLIIDPGCPLNIELDSIAVIGHDVTEGQGFPVGI